MQVFFFIIIFLNFILFIYFFFFTFLFKIYRRYDDCIRTCEIPFTKRGQGQIDVRNLDGASFSKRGPGHLDFASLEGALGGYQWTKDGNKFNTF